MNFSKIIILTLLIVIFSQKGFSENHDTNIVDKAKEVNEKIKEQQSNKQKNIAKETGLQQVEEEPLPLNDPFAADSSSASSVVSEEPTNSATKLREFKLVGSFSAKEHSFATLVDQSGEFMIVELYEELVNGLKLVDINIKQAVFENSENNKFLILNFKHQIKEADEY